MSKINELFYHGGLPLYQAYESNKIARQDGQVDKYEDVIKCISKHINPETSIQTNKCLFRGLYQLDGEPFEDFVQRVKDAAKNCGFGTNEENEAAEQIVQRCHKSLINFKTTYLAKQSFTLQEVVSAGRAAESIINQIELLEEKTSNATATYLPTANVDRVRAQQHHPKHEKRPYQDEPRDTHKFNKRKACYNCGRNHEYKTNCPANGAKCNKCDKLNHFAAVCMSGNHKTSQSD
jgi:hypothetical protein